jgi:hypothetical protein
MTFYPSSEGPDPVLEASWREYRRWRNARRRRRWAAAGAGLALVVAVAAMVWPSKVHHESAAGSAALSHFDAPGRTGKGTVVVASSQPLGTATAPTEAPREVVATPLAPPPPEEMTLTPPQGPAMASPPPPEEGSGSTTPPAASTQAPSETPLPSPKPALETAVASTPAPQSAAPSRHQAPHLQLASFRTEAKAQNVLESLRKEQSDLLGALETRVERAELTDGRIVYRVQAGPLPGTAEAKRLCAELQRRHLECRYVR